MSMEGALFAANTPASSASSLSPMMGVGLGLGAASGVANWVSQQNANTANSNMQDKQIAWQDYWRSNQHQTEVKDLEKAGLNPILSAGGGGAGTPSPGLPNMQAPQIHMPDLLSYGVSLKGLEQAQQKIEIDKANSAASIAKNLSDADLNKLHTILDREGILGKTFGTSSSTVNKGIDSISDKLSDALGWLISTVRHGKLESPRQNLKDYSNSLQIQP